MFSLMARDLKIIFLKDNKTYIMGQA